MQYDRIFCFGDSITLGYNDNSGLGWPGRLSRGLFNNGRAVAMYNLGVNGDTSEHIATRWSQEASARSRNAGALMLFAFGFNDASAADGAALQVKLEDSLANARQILQQAKQQAELLWIGPTPLDETVNPLQTPYASWITYNHDLALYDAAYADLALTLEVDYLRLFPDFIDSERYARALADGDGIHPGDDGYAMIAERIAAWDKWQRYLAPG